MSVKKIKRIGIAGAGTMGSGIAQILARKGYEVVLTDIKEEFLNKSKRLVEIFNSSLIEEGIMSQDEVTRVVSNIEYDTDKNVFHDCDLIIEAIVEKMDIKQDFWREVEEIAKPEAYFATNTSGLSINGISQKVKDKRGL